VTFEFRGERSFTRPHCFGWSTVDNTRIYPLRPKSGDIRRVGRQASQLCLKKHLARFHCCSLFGGNAKRGETVLERGENYSNQSLSPSHHWRLPVGQDSPWKTACGIMLLVLGFAVPLRRDLTGASFSPRRCWGTDWNSFLQSVKVDYNSMTIYVCTFTVLKAWKFKVSLNLIPLSALELTSGNFQELYSGYLAVEIPNFLKLVVNFLRHNS